MFAVISKSGKQYSAELNCSVLLDKTEANVGDVIEVSGTDVLMVKNNDEFSIGKSGSSVKLQVIEHIKGKKVVIFKKRRRKNYERKNGFTPWYTKVLVTEIKA